MQGIKHYLSYTIQLATTEGYVPRKRGRKLRKRKPQDSEILEPNTEDTGCQVKFFQKSFTTGLERNQHRLKQEQKEGQKKQSPGGKKDTF